MNSIYRNEVSLYGVYQRAFFSKAFKEKLISPIEPAQKDIDVTTLAEEDYDRLYKYNPKKTSVLQMFLLFDRITLIDADFGFDYSKLKETGLIDVITLWEEPLLLGQNDWDLATRNYAMYLKPMIIPGLISFLEKDERYALKRRFGLTPKTFFSAFFDMCILPEHTSYDIETFKKVDQYIIEHTEARYIKNKEMWDSNSISKDQAYERIISWWSYHVTESVGKLMTLIDISNQQNTIVVQNEFRELDSPINGMKNIHSNIDMTMEAYGILKMSCEQLIGALPKIGTIQDVLRIKEKRSKDIQRLRTALNEVEYSLKNGETHALRKANKIIAGAAKELNKGFELQKVSKWSTYMSLPISGIEYLFGLPPISGISVGVIGAASTAYSNQLVGKNDWMSVIR
ncbi:hypothetical protein [Thalassomonas actiniarum]|uniref:Uncharacterized protein n=1 Tax=Thalassomonas actiniarum TaxID=485447 RepID=A0AAF0C623_9GAMM|nr:hypothetical protein [Thalassomonas actiniarum]WDE02143.1 hypothetical protein SG35_030760 [Thalassomonas actiniarum]